MPCHLTYNLKSLRSLHLHIQPHPTQTFVVLSQIAPELSAEASCWPTALLSADRQSGFEEPLLLCKQVQCISIPSLPESEVQSLDYSCSF